MFNKENTHDSWFPKIRTFVVSDGSGGEKLGFDGMVRYVRLIMSKLHDPQEIKQVHPRFAELKNFHGIEDERPSVGVASLQKMASGLLCMSPTF
ncbi:tubulin-folding cofactor e [Quercus suber]|uniref:Tubulin-folding cofactor e n=1 Tax=Quercus suber TaxID=58331 RepID=A0AAW0LPD5_QUESU